MKSNLHIFFVVVVVVVVVFFWIVFGLSMDCLCEMVYPKKVFQALFLGRVNSRGNV